MKIERQKGFSIIELLIVIAIIGILGTIVFTATGTARIKARDAKRKIEVAQIGKLLSASCYTPDAGIGEYDIMDLVPELLAKYPQYTNFISQVPIDPKSGTEVESKYIYNINNTGKCAIYANLENKEELVTLQNITTPTAGGGTGVLESLTNGWNGSPKYFQYSN